MATSLGAVLDLLGLAKLPSTLQFIIIALVSLLVSVVSTYTRALPDAVVDYRQHNSTTINSSRSHR